MQAVAIYTEVLNPRSFAEFADGSLRWLDINRDPFDPDRRAYRVLNDGPDPGWFARGKVTKDHTGHPAIEPVFLQEIMVATLNRQLAAEA
jgi:hypothetical protein